MATFYNTYIRYNLWDYLFFIWSVTEACCEHTILSVLAQLLFVIYSFINSLVQRKIKWSYLISLYVLFAFFCWFNIFAGHAISTSTAKKMLDVILRNIVFIVFLFQYLRQVDLKKLKYLFFNACIVSSFIIIILSYLETGFFQLRGVEGSINGNVQAVNNAIAIGWIYCLRNEKLIKRELIMCLFLVLFCILAGTRKAIIVLFMIVIGYTVIDKPYRILTNGIKIAFVSGVLLFLLFKVDFIYDIIGSRFEGFLGFINGNGDIDASTDTRSHFIELGYAYFLKEPIYGYGIDCFREIRGAYDTYSHNNYIELLFGIGLPGTITYYLMYLIPLLKGVYNYFNNRNKNVIIGILIIFACLFSDYGLVSYFSRDTYVKILLCYLFVSTQSNTITNNKSYSYAKT